MRGIVIAAGLGVRMGELGFDLPKCLLPIGDQPLLDWTIRNLRAAGCHHIVVVTGFRSDLIGRTDIVKVENEDYRNNNILHSLMYARAYMDGPLIITYSDIWVEPSAYRTLMDTPGDIVIAVDRDWLSYYEGRTGHPIAEAENVLVDSDRRVVEIGKHLAPNGARVTLCGEFLGLWRMSSKGTDAFRRSFEALDERLGPTSPFQRATEWRKAYVTDLIQQLVDDGVPVDSALVDRGWAELDTPQDYNRLPEIAARQRLFILQAALTRTGREKSA